MNPLRLVAAILIFGSLGCQKRPEKELYGLVNGKPVRAGDIEKRLHRPVDELKQLPMDEKKRLFDEVSNQIIFEEEPRRLKMSESRLMQFFDLIESVSISPRERQEFTKRNPEFKSQGEAALAQAIRRDRRGQVEAKYRSELRQRSTVKFLADDPKQAHILGFW